MHANVHAYVCNTAPFAVSFGALLRTRTARSRYQAERGWREGEPRRILRAVIPKKAHARTHADGQARAHTHTYTLSHTHSHSATADTGEQSRSARLCLKPAFNNRQPHKPTVTHTDTHTHMKPSVNTHLPSSSYSWYSSVNRVQVVVAMSLPCLALLSLLLLLL